ncbi:hypothetical protein K438DRAFT_1952938 [Mycena galopus ATCC 62051]|nr:hypothetical protein K438DRAFT_1952938 [Mycena galopus ATCC 62051]
MFNTAEILQGEIKSYRSFAFPPALWDRTHDPFFSVENSITWITSRGYQLYLEHDDAQTSLSLWDPDQVTPSQIRAYCSVMIGDAYIEHSFFSLDNTDSWISLLALHTYMNIFHGSFDGYRTRNSTPFSSCAPSRAVSSLGSRARSRADCSFSRDESRPSSRTCFLPALCAPPSHSSSPFGNDLIEISSDSDNDLSAALPAPPLVPKMEDTAPQRKGKQKADEGKIQITRQESVDQIVEISTIPSTWPVPRTPTAYLIDLSNSLHLLKRENGFDLSIDSMDFNLQVLDEYFASSGAGSDPYTPLFPEGEGRNRGFEYLQQPLNWSASMVSQELPVLFAPQLSTSPSHTEPDEPISVDENDYVAPQDVNLNLAERNVLPGNSNCQRFKG